MKGAESFDNNLHHLLNRTRTAQQNQELLMVHTGGLCTAKNLHRAGFLESELCPYCKQAPEDLNHLWWECPQHECRRKAVREMLGNDCVQLPECLRLHGIPVQPAADITGPLWQTDQATGEQPQRQQLAGDAHFAWMEALQDLGYQNENDLTNITAQQLGHQMQGDFGDLPAWENIGELGDAPVHVTTYTDGGGLLQ